MAIRPANEGVSGKEAGRDLTAIVQIWYAQTVLDSAIRPPSDCSGTDVCACE